MENRRRQPVKIHLPRGQQRNVTRWVRAVNLTGHIAKGWMGGTYYQWVGFIHYSKQIMKVWGYSSSPQTYPVEWANDTY